jgi:hypothetical protein
MRLGVSATSSLSTQATASSQRRLPAAFITNTGSNDELRERMGGVIIFAHYNRRLERCELSRSMSDVRFIFSDRSTRRWQRH